MGNACVRPSTFSQVDVGDAAAPGQQVQQSPPSAAKLAAARESSSQAAEASQAAPLSPRPPSGSKTNAAPRPGQKKCCFAEGPATEWQIPAAAESQQSAASTAQPQQP